MSTKILITGNNGYIGSVLTKILVERGYDIVGLDTNFYGSGYNNITQITKDIRNITKKDLKNIDSIIHLAGLSNDPLCRLNPKLTMDINYEATVRLAKLAKENKVKRFVFTSSQSVYGISKDNKELSEDDPKNPITPYGESKLLAEEELKKLDAFNFTTVCFRPSTVFGSSPNLRCDIVYNDLLCSGYTTKKILIRSDGTPWRPVVHIQDVCNALIAGLEAPKEIVSGESFNIGIEGRNYQIKDLATAAKKILPTAEIVYTGEHGPDARDYKISFSKIQKKLEGYYTPKWGLSKGGSDLLEFLKSINFNEEMYIGREFNRLRKLIYLREKDMLNEELYWK